MALDTITDLLEEEPTQENIVAAERLLEIITSFLNSDEYIKTKEFISQAMERLTPQLERASEECKTLAPYIEFLSSNPEFKGLTVKDVFSCIDGLSLEVDEQAPERIKQIVSKARFLRDSLSSIEDLAEKKELLLQYIGSGKLSAADLPRITYHNTKQVKAVTDKLMNMFFSIAAPMGKGTLNGQLAMIPVDMIPVKYEGRGRKKITLFYDFVYNENALENSGIPKGFGSYEFFVATALDNLLENGNNIVSYSKILEEMGVTGRPSAEDIAKLSNALIKGATTTIHINDLEVQRAWGNSDRYTEFVGPVFPIMIRNERYIASGFIADGAIKINDYSPFRALANSLGHLTQWDKQILQLYTGRKTDRYWCVMQFLIREIGWMRNAKSKRSCKILYSTLYAHTGDKTTRTKQLTRDMLYRLLDEVFIPTGYIKSYKEDNGTSPGVVLNVADQRLLQD